MPRPSRKPTDRAQALDLARRRGVIRPRELRRLGIYPMVLTRLTEEGLLERIGRGLYRLADAPPMGAPDLVLVAARAPRAVFGLVTALDHHDLTTEIPRTVDILLPRGIHPPRLESPPLRVFSVSGDSIRKGIKSSTQDGVSIRMTVPAKTVADCFKYRRRVGLEVALEALKEGLLRRTFTPASFANYAKGNRVLTFVRPYLDSLL